MRTENIIKFLLKSSFLIFNIAWCIVIFIGLRKAKSTIADSYAKIAEGELPENSIIYKSESSDQKLKINVKTTVSGVVSGTAIHPYLKQEETENPNANKQKYPDSELPLDNDQKYYFVTLPQLTLVINVIIFLINQILINIEANYIFRTLRTSKHYVTHNLSTKSETLEQNLKKANGVSRITVCLHILSMLGLAISTWFASNLECDFGENVLSCDNDFQMYYLTGFWLILSWVGVCLVGISLKWYWQISVGYDKIKDDITFG